MDSHSKANYYQDLPEIRTMVKKSVRGENVVDGIMKPVFVFSLMISKGAKIVLPSVSLLHVLPVLALSFARLAYIWFYEKASRVVVDIPAEWPRLLILYLCLTSEECLLVSLRAGGASFWQERRVFL